MGEILGTLPIFEGYNSDLLHADRCCLCRFA